MHHSITNAFLLYLYFPTKKKRNQFSIVIGKKIGKYLSDDPSFRKSKPSREKEKTKSQIMFHREFCKRFHRETRRTREVVGGEEKRRVRRKKALQSQHFGRSRVIYAFNTRSSHSSGKKKIYIYILIPTSFKKLSRKGGWSRLVRMEGEESGVKASHQLSRGRWK